VGVVTLFALILGWMILPWYGAHAPHSEDSFRVVLWWQRGLDVLVQVALIFVGAIGVLGLLGIALYGLLVMHNLIKMAIVLQILVKAAALALVLGLQVGLDR
jgi:hypothetical protein